MSESVLGLPFDDIEAGTALSAVLVVKLLTNDGEVMYAVRTTEQMNLVDIVGMLRYATLHYERQFIRDGEINED